MATICKYIDKLRDKNNRIKSYKLLNIKGETTEIDAEYLKQEIAAERLYVVNLTLTSDNRLVDKQLNYVPNARKLAAKESAIKIIQKSKLLGREPMRISAVKSPCYLVSQTPERHILYVPDATIGFKFGIIEILEELRGSIKVIGGSNLTTTQLLFFECSFDLIDLSDFDTHNVMSMESMFQKCSAQKINFTDFDTSSVVLMNNMFAFCDTTDLDLTSFDTRNVKDMKDMFTLCHTKSINLSHFNTNNVTNMSKMFEHFECPDIDLSSFDTHNVTQMEHIFFGCTADNLDISNFDISKVKNTEFMFSGCTAKIKTEDSRIKELLNE